MSLILPSPTIGLNSPLDGFGALRTVERTTIFENKSSAPTVSAIRNVTSVTGSATATVANGEYVLATTASTSDSIEFTTGETGRYMPGYSCQAGIGVRLSTATFSGTQEAKWGYYDDDDGLYFGLDSTGFYVRRRKSGSDQAKVYQSSFNVDTVDGSGASGLTIDLTDGNIFQINFTWYGYGVILFQVVLPDSTLAQQQRVVTLHTINVDGAASIDQPNLPIRVELDNGDQATARTVYVGGRQFSIIGDFNPTSRYTADYRLSVATSTTWTPIISFRKKSASTFQRQIVRPLSVGALSGEDHLVALVFNATLTTPSWGSLTNITATETALERDISATSLTGGEYIDIAFAAGAKGSATVLTTQGLGDLVDLVNQIPLTVAVRTVASTSTISVNFKCIEQW